MQPALPIYSADQIKAIDAYTISHELISSIDLMERAALACTNWICNRFDKIVQFKVFCGLGNNGGDGLAVARQLMQRGYGVEVYVIYYSQNFSQDFLSNKQKFLTQFPNSFYEIRENNQLPKILPSDVIIDALFGIGLTKPLEGILANCVDAINKAGTKIIAIDVPSGLFADKTSSLSESIIKATYTLTFQYPKLSFLLPENSGYVGKGHLLNIGLLLSDELKSKANTFYVREDFIKQLFKPRAKFSHKGTYGHALLISGSHGKMGAAIMSALSVLRSGVGLLTVIVPKCGYDIIQTSVPEAMALVSGENEINIKDILLTQYSTIGIGPGIGPESETQQSVKFVLENSKIPLVIDADALNAISTNKSWLNLIPENSILTPHPKEFERLTKHVHNDFERHELQKEFSKKYKVYLVLKGAHTCITTPEGKSYFNSTGNSGLAKGGSGDVLTGLITGILAQGYSSFEAALMGVYIHGLAADITRSEKGETVMIPTDVIANLPHAFKKLIES